MKIMKTCYKVLESIDRIAVWTGLKQGLRISWDLNLLDSWNSKLQKIFFPGYINLISLLIDYGATTALLNPQGTLFTSPEFEGARALIEGHRNEHTLAVMKLVRDKSKKAHLQLAKIWVVGGNISLCCSFHFFVD